MEAQHTQRMQALLAANEVRTARARIKKVIKTGEVDPVNLLQGIALGDAMDELLDRAKFDKVLITDFLTWIPYIGDEKARKIVFFVNIREGLTFQHLTPMRRTALTNRLRMHHSRNTTYGAGQSARVGTVAAVTSTAA